jgi:HEAT repeat protein
VLIALLARRDARSAARTALLGLGERAVAALGDALRDPNTDAAVRRHLPRTIHRFGTPDAAGALLRALPGADPEVRYKILRGLGRMRADDPGLAIPETDLRDHAGRALDRAIEMLSFRVGYLAWCGLHADAAPANECVPDLLGAVIEDKESRALERVFRVLHIIEPGSDFDAIFAALRAPAPAAQAGALELIEHIVDEELRSGVIAMFGVEDPVERLRAATRRHGPARARALADALPAAGEPIAEPDRAAVEAALESLFDEMIADPDPILASVARHRLGEPATATRVQGGGRAPR